MVQTQNFRRFLELQHEKYLDISLGSKVAVFVDQVCAGLPELLLAHKLRVLVNSVVDQISILFNHACKVIGP